MSRWSMRVVQWCFAWASVYVPVPWPSKYKGGAKRNSYNLDLCCLKIRLSNKRQAFFAQALFFIFKE